MIGWWEIVDTCLCRDVTLRIEGGSIHIKTQKPHGDPVELSEEDALELAAIVTQRVTDLRRGNLIGIADYFPYP